MAGAQGPSGREQPEILDLRRPPINYAFISGLSNPSPCVYPSSHPPIADASSSRGFPGHWPSEYPSFENPISSPAFASSSSSSSPSPYGHWPPQDPSLEAPISFASSSSSSPSPLGHWPPQDPSRQPQIAAAPFIVNQSEDILALDSLGKGSRIPIIISRQFPLKNLLWLSRRIANEMTQPVELRVFEVANQDILGELQNKLFLLSKRLEFLTEYENKCHLAITTLRDIKNLIMSLERISADGIQIQILVLEETMKCFSREIEVVRQALGM